MGNLMKEIFKGYVTSHFYLLNIFMVFFVFEEKSVIRGRVIYTLDIDNGILFDNVKFYNFQLNFMLMEVVA